MEEEASSSKVIGIQQLQVIHQVQVDWRCRSLESNYRWRREQGGGGGAGQLPGWWLWRKWLMDAIWMHLNLNTGPTQGLYGGGPKHNPDAGDLVMD